EPYFVELQDPAATHILLTADYGPGFTSPAIGTLYPRDTSLLADGRTRVIGYTRAVGKGAVTYIALGHCHNPPIRAARPPDAAAVTRSSAAFDAGASGAARGTSDTTLDVTFGGGTKALGGRSNKIFGSASHCTITDSLP